MKMTKMSLLAALLIASSTFAIENTKVSGDVKFYYDSSDAKAASPLQKNSTGTPSLFDTDSSAADIGLNLNLTTDLIKLDMVSVSAGVGTTVLSTLGLENNLVGNVWGGAHTAVSRNGLDDAKIDSAFWMNEVWMAITAGKTTAKLGRMELDTPLIFTEKWSIEKNTFEAVVLINQDISGTTLVGAFVGNGNGTEPFGVNAAGASSAGSLGLTANSSPSLTSNASNGVRTGSSAVVNGNGKFATYGSDGAYIVGAINNSWEPLTLQAWYYDLTRIVDAYWLQADLNMEGVLVGAQYSSLTFSKDAVINGITPFATLGGTPFTTGENISSDVYAFMLGYEMKDVFTIKGAYSQVGKGFAAGFNTATNTGDSKVYTQAWWSRSYVTQADTQSYRVSVCSPVNGIVDLGVHYTNANQAEKNAAGVMLDNDLQEITLTVGKTFGPLDAILVYSNIDAKNQNLDTDVFGAKIARSGSAYNQIQAYLTLNF